MTSTSRSHRSKVAVIRCDSYDETAVFSAITRGMNLLGDSISILFNPGEQILIKPNMLQASPPENAACTHPAVFKSVAQWLMNRRTILSYGDSPAIAGPVSAARANGLSSVAESLSIPMADFHHGVEVKAPRGCMNRSFYLAQGIKNADSVVSVSKLKTHGFTGMTGAVKNQLGCIPGLRKAEYHARLPDPDSFSRMLVELTLTVAPKLFIMDGIIAMEGKGPNAGTPEPVNVILISTDPVALDRVAAGIIGFPEDSLYVVKHGIKLKLGAESDPEILGDDPIAFRSKDFKLADLHFSNQNSLLIRLFRNRILPRPVVNQKLCSSCRKCTEICPVEPKAVTFDSSSIKPVFSYPHCIRCYCCHEVCPDKAIDIKVPVAGKLLRSITRK